MLVLPLGLGTRLRRFPWVTLLLVFVWIIVQVTDQSSGVIVRKMFTEVSRTGVRDVSRSLFEEYCMARHGTPSRCQQYAVLVWTGFPGRKGARVYAGMRAQRGTWRDLVNKRKKKGDTYTMAAVAELERAGAVKKQLKNCGKSKTCFRHKDIIWKFLENHRTNPAVFSGLKSYQKYASSMREYKNGLVRICRKHNCLVKGNVNAMSLGLAQVRHGGFLHLFSNVFALVIFGIYVEQRTGRLLYLLGIVLGGTVGMLVHALAFGSSENIVLGGSANVSAVMGMFFVFFYHHRMRFMVWLPRKIYSGSRFFADVKYCFPLLFVLTDVSGGFDPGFASLADSKVAHFAHLGGLVFGIGWAMLIRQFLPLPRPFVFEYEKADWEALMGSRSLPEVMERAEDMLTYNPENTAVMEYATNAFLNWAQVARPNENASFYDRGRMFISEYMPQVCAIHIKRGNLRHACAMLARLPLYLPYRIYLHSLGQRTILLLGDFALANGHPVAAFRMYDFFLTRYPLSLKCESIQASATEVLQALQPTRENCAVMRQYLTFHPESQLASHVGAWLNNTERKLA